MKRITPILIGTLCSLFILPTMAWSGGCGYSRCGYSYPSYPTYSYPTVVEKIVYVSQFYPAYVPTPFTTYVPPAVVPAVPLSAIAPVAPGIAPAPVAVQASVIPAVAQPVVAAAQGQPVQPPPVPVAMADPCAAKIQAALAPLLARMDKMDAENKDLRARLVNPPGPQPPPPEKGPAPKEEAKGPPEKLSLTHLTGQNCAACHDAKVAEKKGGKLVLSREGKPVYNELSDRQLRMVTRKVQRGEMPPPDNKEGIKPFTQQEGDAYLQQVDAIDPVKK